MSGRYLVVIEGNASSNYSAYSPELPGVVATGRTRSECERHMQEAIAFHIEGLRAEGQPVPAPISTGVYVDEPSAPQ